MLKVQGMRYGNEFSSVFWWMLFLYFGFGKPNFAIGGFLFRWTGRNLRSCWLQLFFMVQRKCNWRKMWS